MAPNFSTSVIKLISNELLFNINCKSKYKKKDPDFLRTLFSFIGSGGWIWTNDPAEMRRDYEPNELLIILLKASPPL